MIWFMWALRLAQLAQDLLAHLRQRAAAELLVEEVRGALQLIGE